MIRMVWLAPVLVVGTLVLASCGDDNKTTTTSAPTPQTPAQAQAQLCSSLNALATALQPLENIGSGATVVQIQGSLTSLKSALNGVEQSAKDVKDVKTADLQSAVDGLEKAIKDIPQSGGVSQAEQSLKTAAAGIQTAWTDVKTKANCNS